MPLISLIIPVYKISEQYIRRCLESLCNQTSKNFTAIVVDDGSPDDCGKICDEYSTKDSRIKVIHKENEGVSIARNTAIDACDTEWIAFVDPDDWVETNLIECLENAISSFDADVYYYDYFHEFPRSTYNRQLPFEEGVISEENIQSLRLAPFNFFSCNKKSVEYETNTLWNKMFKASVIKDNNILFEPAAVKGQDVIFICEALQCAKKFFYLKKSLYHYRHVETSITNRYNPYAMKYNEIAFKCQAEIISKYHLSEEYANALNSRICTRMYSSMRLYYFNSNNQKPYSEIKKEILTKLEQEPYKSAFKNVRYSLLSKQQKIFVFTLKHKWIALTRLLVKIRTIIRRTN